MCGRYSFLVEDTLIKERFGVDVRTAIYKASYNCAPTQTLAVITNDDRMNLSFLRWGLIPSWAKDPSIGNKMINARSETILEKPSFRTPFRKRRCLVPASGFYEWKRMNGKTPYHFVVNDEQLFAMAGLWDEWRSPSGEIIRSFTIITTAPNELVAEVHDRMPVILPRDKESNWLDPATDAELLSLLVPFPADQMSSSPSSLR